MWGNRAGSDITGRRDLAPVVEDTIPPWRDTSTGDSPDTVLLHRDTCNIQDVMWLYVGLARNNRRLLRALNELNQLWGTIDDSTVRTV